MPLDSVRISGQGRDQLINLKRRTGIENWNVLCRWALCISLAAEQRVPDSQIVTDSNIEIPWRIFAGDLGDIYWAALKERCRRDGVDVQDEAALGQQFKLHVHRGISYLAGERLESVADLINLTAADAS